MIVTALRKTRIDAYQFEGQSCLSENRSGDYARRPAKIATL